MLLRSASTPVLNSLVHASSPRESTVDADFVHHIPRTRPMVLSTSSCCCYSPMSVQSSDDSTRRMSRAMSESNLRDLSAKPASTFLNGAPAEEKIEEGIGFGLLRASSLECGFGLGMALEEDCEVLVGTGAGGIGGKIYCGGGGAGSDGGDRNEGCGSWDSNHGNDVIEAHYQNIIAENPGNGLLLSNYAKFLKEIRGDIIKAEEYCSRAILANPNDGGVLSMYGDLIWQCHGDSSRAETYFDQAVKAAPDDCYVLASYAQFLWNAEDEDEKKQVELERQTTNLGIVSGPAPITSPA